VRRRPVRLNANADKAALFSVAARFTAFIFDLFNNRDQLTLDPPRAHETVRCEISIFDPSELNFCKLFVGAAGPLQIKFRVVKKILGCEITPTLLFVCVRG